MKIYKSLIKKWKKAEETAQAWGLPNIRYSFNKCISNMYKPSPYFQNSVLRNLICKQNWLEISIKIKCWEKVCETKKH